MTFKRHIVVLFKIMSNVLREGKKGATCGAASIFSLTFRHACDAHASLKYVIIFFFFKRLQECIRKISFFLNKNNSIYVYKMCYCMHASVKSHCYIFFYCTYNFESELLLLKSLTTNFLIIFINIALLNEIFIYDLINFLSV